MDLYIGEEQKRVIVRDDLPYAAHIATHDRFFQLDEKASWRDHAKALQPLIESWEFDGDPEDEAAWGMLDTFEIIELENKLAADLGDDLELRHRFPAAEFDGMAQQFRKLADRLHWRKRASILIPFIARFDRLEDYTDPDQWAELNLFEVIAVEQAVTELVLERMQRAKN